jgi:hypothetical protein
MNARDKNLRDQDAMAPHLVDGMTEGRKKAFELAAEAAKQLLTLSVGVIAFSVTFLKDIFGVAAATVSPKSFALLFAMWAFYLASAVAGVITLNFLAGRALDVEPQLKGSSAQSAGRWQMILFAIALLLTVAFGISLAVS